MKLLRWYPLLFGCTIFFLISYKFFFKDLLPMPLDLLIAEYAPWRFESYFGYLPGTFPSKVQYFDVIRQMLPWKYFAIDAIKNGAVPLWNPYNFSGTPLLANNQSAVFYPLNILFYVFKFTTAWSIYLFLQPFLTFFFTYAYVRKIKLEIIPSVFASTAFTLSLFLSAFFEYGVFGHTILWLPFLFFCIEELFNKKRIYLILFPLGIAFCFFAGHLQLFGFVALAVVVYIAYKAWMLKDKKSAFICLGLIALGIFLSGIGLLPLLDMIQKSARSNHSAEFIIREFLFKPSNLILFLAPDFYGNPVTRNFILHGSYPAKALYIGMIPLIFSLFSIFSAWKNSLYRIYIIIPILVLLLLVDSPLSRLVYALQVPIVSTGSPLHMIFLVSFSLSILSGIGLQTFIEKGGRKNMVMILISVFVVLLVNLILIFSKLSEGNRNSVIIAFILLGTAAFLLLFMNFVNRLKSAVLVLLVTITILDGYYFFQKFNPFIDEKLFYPSTTVITYLQNNAGLNRFWGFGQAAIDTNFQTYFKIFSPEGYDPLYLKDYGAFIYSAENGKLLNEFESTTRSDAAIRSSYFDGGLGESPYRAKILNTLGVKYILDRVENGSTEKKFPESTYKMIYNENGWKIYENNNAAERFFLTSSYMVYKTPEEFESIFFSDSFDPGKMVLVENSVKGIREGGNNDISGKIDLVSYNANKIEFSVSVDKNALLFLSDSYDKGWKGFVDGKNAEVLKANYSFRAITVPAGIHSVELIYKPSSYELGKILSLIGIVLLVGQLFIIKKYDYIQKK